MTAPAWPDRERWVARDLQLALTLNRVSALPAICALCRVVSRLGDGGMWYGVIALLPLAAGKPGWQCALHMLVAGSVSLLAYLLLKRYIGRVRPYEKCPKIHLRGKVLDRFSFPSGHTLHSTGFALVLTYHFPAAAIALIPFTLLLGLSRIVLGLHYPSDVAAGAVLGMTIGLGAVWLL